MNEPRTWTLPEEPPVGTVVGAGTPDGRRWKRRENLWFQLREDGQLGLAFVFGLTWPSLLRECNGTVREYPDPADPDGRQSELDKLRAEVERLTNAAEYTKRDHDVLLSWVSRFVTSLNGEWVPEAELNGQCVKAEAALANLRQSLRDAAENRALAEKDRDNTNQNARVAGEQLFRAQRERGEALTRQATAQAWVVQLVRAATGTFDFDSPREPQVANAITCILAARKHAGAAVTP